MRPLLFSPRLGRDDRLVVDPKPYALHHPSVNTKKESRLRVRLPLMMFLDGVNRSGGRVSWDGDGVLHDASRWMEEEIDFPRTVFPCEASAAEVSAHMREIVKVGCELRRWASSLLHGTRTSCLAL